MQKRATVAALVGFLCFGCTWETPAPAQKPPVKKDMAESLLAAVRQPEPGQFGKPEDVVRFLLTAVGAQDFDEATKAFPVRERFERVSLEHVVRRNRVYMPARTPLPGARFHNARLAFEDCVYTCFQLTMACLDVDADRMRPFEEDALDDGIAKLQKELDLSRLAGLKVTSVSRTALRMPVTSEVHKAMGVTGLAMLDAEWECNGQKLKWQFVAGRMGDNWRIVGSLGSP
jgi:hypothetical protein